MNRLPAYLVCLFSIGITFQLSSQQLSLFTQYRENQTILNPAAPGSNYLGYGQNLTFGASYRVQWQGFDNAPTTGVLRGEYLYESGSSFNLLSGGYLIHDQTGPTGFTGLYGRLGGVLSDDPEYGGLSVGLSVGAVQYRVKTSDLRLRDQNDIVATDDQNRIYPDVGLGVFAYRQFDGGLLDGDYLYGGVSVPQVIGLDLSFKDEDGKFYTKRVQHYYAMIGMYKFFSDRGFIEPSIWVKYVHNTPINIDFNLRYQLAQNFWVGVGGATAKTMHVELGFLLGENLGFDNTLKIGYGFDYSFSTFGPYTGGSHEINITYSLDK
ncbi:MAG: PorP/SprF family type IX secretion system membrane protein [Saprospiraceae bacterium]|nr:PorP/SprF family type IX secretion system membrane protein [Saprospiraceae bacterium]